MHLAGLDAREFGPGGGRVGQGTLERPGSPAGESACEPWKGATVSTARRKGPLSAKAMSVRQVSGKTSVLWGVSALDSFGFAENFTIVLTLTRLFF